ncbi:HTH-type transcriptional repressor CzrA [Caloramator mitchellensis]|uniref:HTH-type transcriptional repressor CzrA n=1 Tax=Caloramator mitchellensis TaxID=908809 RepID=A0A0R3K062_CALMK|nr:metalloregulator ArsR/SmtB family transcription factor [Caloramator mitchellensis]KRQ87917.1 HTH-type transcriptional repressor CzrA [Caloramator mitchellensis]
MFKILGNPIRVSILSCLLKGDSNVTRIQKCLDLPQSTVSQQLGILKNAGIIEGNRHGLEIIYSIVDVKTIETLKLFLADSLEKEGIS